MTTQHELVKEFNEKFQVPVRSAPQELNADEFEFRLRFMDEELREFVDAWMTHDVVKQADALIDLAYVVHGTALMMGLPWEKLFMIVHQANMRKMSVAELSARGISTGGSRHAYDVRKPPEWQPPEPELRQVLRAVHIQITGEEGPFA